MEIERKTEQLEAHLLIFPFPIQGHVTTMLRLANALSAAGLRISFVNTEHNHRLLGRFSGSSHRSPLSLRPNFRFLSIPDGLSDDNPRSVDHILELEASLRTRSVDSFRSLLLSGGSRGSVDWPPVTCLLVDGIMTFAMDAAQNLGIPTIIFRTISASCIWAYLRIPHLIEAGEIPFPAEGADLDEPIRSIPGMESFLRRRDLPKTFRKAWEGSGSSELQLLGDISASAVRARGVILNTCESLEGNILKQIRSVLPVTYAVGPLHALAAAITSSSFSTSLREEDRSVFEWLDAQPNRSVVYASFGSLAKLTRAEFLEFWNGFVDSGHRFLWVLRPNLVEDGEEVRMPETERVRLVDWVPQEEVLRHRAVGCFLTHSGWNSTLESVAAGVAMVCWPFFMDQQVNSRLVGEVWKVGLDMKDVCRKEVVERTVRAAMEGETAERLRRSVAESAEEVWRSVGEGGSSRLDFERLVQDILLLSKERTPQELKSSSRS